MSTKKAPYSTDPQMQNSGKCTVVVSNHFDALLQALAENLFALPPLSPKFVVVPCKEKSDEILHRLALSPRWGVCAGVEFLSLHQFLRMLAKDLVLPSSTELFLLVENQLRAHISDPLWEPVRNYLQRQGGDHERALSAISKHIASLFLHYGSFGERFLHEWLCKEGWQQALWREVFSNGWTPLLEMCALTQPFAHPVHLFGFSHMPSEIASFLKRLSAHLYFLSPTPLFIGDIFTDRQRLFLEKAYEKRGIRVQEIAGALTEPHPLASEWMHLKGRTLALLEEEGVVSDELYTPPDGGGTLGALKAELFELKPPEPRPPDESLSVHSFSSILHEVRFLKEHIEREIRKGIPLRELAVLALDLELYATHIRAVFGTGPQPIPFMLAGVEEREACAFSEGLMHALRLKEGRFEKEDVLKLFECAPFYEKASLDAQEAASFQKLLKKTVLLWGIDAEHRESILQIQERVSDVGTWKWVSDQLLLSLACEPLGGDGGLSLTEAKMVGDGIAAINALKKGLDALDGMRSFVDWVEALQRFIQTLFIETAQAGALIDELKGMKKRFKTAEKIPLPLSSILEVLSAYFAAHKQSSKQGNIEVVCFHPLKEGSIPSANTLWVVGMQAEAFPKKGGKNPFVDADYLQKSSAPLPAHAARALFLDALLLAKEGLHIFYVHTSEEDGKEAPPSPLVQELLGALGKREAVVHAATMKRKKNPLTPFFTPLAKEGRPLRTITVQELEGCFRHPLKHWMQHSLGIYMSRQEEPPLEFVLSPLALWKARQWAGSFSFEQIVRRLEQQGMLPLWQFRHLAEERLKEEIEEHVQRLKELKVDRKGLFSIELVEGLSTHEVVSEELELVPALKIPGVGVITGRIDALCAQGALVDSKGSFEDLFKVWPRALVLQSLETPKLQERSLLFSRGGVKRELQLENIETLLEKMFRYATWATSHPSLLMPEWAELFLQGDAKGVEETMQRMQKEGHQGGKDPYLKWFFAREPNFDVRAHVEEVVPMAREVFRGAV